MPGWDVTVRPAKEEKKKDDSTWVIVVILIGGLLLCLLYGGHGGVQGPGTDRGCAQPSSHCDRGSGSGGHRWNGRGSGHDGEDRDPPDRRGP